MRRRGGDSSERAGACCGEGAGDECQPPEAARGSVPFQDFLCLRFWSHFQRIRFPIDMRDR